MAPGHRNPPRSYHDEQLPLRLAGGEGAMLWGEQAMRAQLGRAGASGASRALTTWRETSSDGIPFRARAQRARGWQKWGACGAINMSPWTRLVDACWERRRQAEMCLGQMLRRAGGCDVSSAPAQSRAPAVPRASDICAQHPAPPFQQGQKLGLHARAVVNLGVEPAASLSLIPPSPAACMAGRSSPEAPRGGHCGAYTLIKSTSFQIHR